MARVVLFCFCIVVLHISLVSCQNWWDAFENPPSEPTPTDPALNNVNDDLVNYYDINDEGICCECVPFYLCSGNGTVIDTGGPVLDPRFGGNTPERNVEVCSDVEQFCCKVPSAPENCMTADRSTGGKSIDNDDTCQCIHWELCFEEFRVTDGSPSTTFVHGNPLPGHSKCNHDLHVCCAFEPEPAGNGPVTETPPSSTVPPQVFIEDQRCYGARNTDGIRVKISGFKDGESQFGEFPWVGMVLNTYFVAGQPMNNFIGGATLIHPRVLLTAAHKVINESVNTLNVRVGEWDIQTDFEPGEHQIRNVERVIIHPDFHRTTLYHDVALLILEEPVVLQPHIRSICMAHNIDEVDTSRCVINGWGEDSFGSDNYQTVMKSVELPFVPHRRCQAMLRRTRLGRWFKLHPSFVCAGGIAGKDACRSDGGGPLACPRLNNPTEYLLVGVTAWGVGCGEDGVPGVYASVLEERSWIMQEMGLLLADSHNLLKRSAPALPSSSGDTTAGKRNQMEAPSKITTEQTTITTDSTIITTDSTTTTTEPKEKEEKKGTRQKRRIVSDWRRNRNKKRRNSGNNKRVGNNWRNGNYRSNYPGRNRFYY